MRELILSSGPARYFGGSIETFALPYGAFIVIALVLYYILKRPHTVPGMKYLRPAHQTSVGTREPGTAGVITLHRAPAPAPVTEAPVTEAPAAKAPAAEEPAAEAPAQQPPAPQASQQADAAAPGDQVPPAAGDQPDADA